MKLFNNVLSFNNSSENDVLSVEPRAGHEGDEELRSVGVLSGVGHGKEVRDGVFFLEVLVLELVAIDGLSSSAVVSGEISTLGHEVSDDTMESTSLVSESLFSSAESSEVFSSLGDDVVVEFKSNSAWGAVSDDNVKPNSCSSHSLKLI